MSLLTICQNACDEIGLKRPTAIIGSSDTTARRCLRFAIRTGREMVKMSYPYLVKEDTLSTVASQEAYDLPSDFHHFYRDTQWNRSTNRKMFPIDPVFWQELKSGLVTAQINERFRIRGSDRQLLLEPTPTSVETLAYEYVSKNYCETNGGVGQEVWTNDTDVGVIDEEIFELGVIWRLLNRIGEPFAEEKAEYQDRLDTDLGQINPQKVHLDGVFPTQSNIPDANFPS